MHLKKMRVRNFRSLEDIAIDFKQFSILTGNNDVGKSNFLRALNLFFNGHTDSGIEFEFINDFSKTWRAESKKAKEISITLTISPPATYEGGGAKDIVWEKNGVRLDSIAWRSSMKMAVTFLADQKFLHGLKESSFIMFQQLKATNTLRFF